MKIFIALLTVLFVSPFAMAADGSSGCGPGWYLFKQNSLISSALRATTNTVLFPLMTVGMTIGTSNCTQHSIVKTEQESLHFATMNKFELKGDVAKGQGHYVTAFANVIGCDNSAQEHFGSEMRRNYGLIFSSPQASPETILTEVYGVILRDKVLADKCSLHLS